MKKIISYWCEDKPTLEDIELAFKEVLWGSVVEIKWYVEYSGIYSRTIRDKDVNKYSAEEYFKKCLPHKHADKEEM